MQVPRTRIPVFVSAPSPENLNPDQEASAEIIHKLVRSEQLEWRALGRSEYNNELPLREILGMVRHCSGGIILGFEQFRASKGEYWPGGSRATTVVNEVFPTPWNQLEAGILFAAGLPMMLFREPGIKGGVFDVGSTEYFIHPMPTATMTQRAKGDLKAVFKKWAAKVQGHYYGD